MYKVSDIVLYHWAVSIVVSSFKEFLNIFLLFHNYTKLADLVLLYNFGVKGK